jgi:hypothetical protein
MNAFIGYSVGIQVNESLQLHAIKVDKECNIRVASKEGAAPFGDERRVQSDDSGFERDEIL